MQFLIILLTLVIWGLIFWLLWWGLGEIKLPEPFNKAAVVMLVLASIVIIVGVLTGTIPPFPFLATLLTVKK
jgi:heme A synthase